METVALLYFLKFAIFWVSGPYFLTFGVSRPCEDCSRYFMTPDFPTYRACMNAGEKMEKTWAEPLKPSEKIVYHCYKQPPFAGAAGTKDTSKIAVHEQPSGAAGANDLDNITVSVEPDLSYWNHAGDGFHVAVKVQNDTSITWFGVNFECLGYADGQVVSIGVGSARNVRPNAFVRESTGLYHFKKPPTEVSCRATDGLDQSKLDRALGQ